MIGIDPSATNIAAAKLHADKGHLSIDYRCTTVEEMDVRERFDIVLAMEVIEHVTDVGAFLSRCAVNGQAGGMMVVICSTTLNRNWKSFAFASAPNTCCAGCRAAPIVGQVRHPR